MTHEPVPPPTTVPTDTSARRNDPGDLLLELLAFPSVTGQERALADWLATRYADRGESVHRIGDSLVVGRPRSGVPTVLLVGHIDVVPYTPADGPPHRDGTRIVGRGASDMKAGLAVAMHCFEDPALRAGPYGLFLVAYAREEGPHDGNELGPLLEEVNLLRNADLAIVLEPTDLQVHLGCMGAVHVELRFGGRAAHSARPWHGENALTKAWSVLRDLHERPASDVEVDGLVYREVLVATQAATHNARNVVPDRFDVNLNYRFAPDKTLDEAIAAVDRLVADRARSRVVDRAPAGHPYRDHPMVAAFLDAVAAPVGPKQAWTDVARFSAFGIPALNYGPGLTAQAHQAGEYVPEANLTSARAALTRFLGPL